MWEQAILPLRCQAYAPRHLNDLIVSGQWTWWSQYEGDDARLAFVEREMVSQLSPPNPGEVVLSAAASAVMEVLRGRGALFGQEIAAQSRLPMPGVRAALWSLLRLGLVTTDQFDVFRRGEPPGEEPPPMRSQAELRAFLRDGRRRRETTWPDGRWALVPWGQPDAESAACFQARLLLDRYGVVSRELALLNGCTTSWRVLYEILSSMELAGAVRRGYFVEGLSGAQFALPDAADLLHQLAMPSTARAPALLVHSLDPANLYGSGAALEIPQGTEDARAFQRRQGNWLIVKAGRPVLLIEQHGKRLTTIPPANPSDLAQATACLPELLKLIPGRDIRHKLSVETWDGEPVTGTLGKHLLDAVGFVRDYQAMTLYAVWQP
jgi:ATP-dependent Lhr-like helicase